jgi:anaerobic selenocysteine-containing dehydrogenase
MLAEVDASGALVKLVGNPQHGYSAGHLCGKTAIFREVQDSADRLRTPLVRKGGELVPATWDEALERIRERVKPMPPESILALGYAGNMGRLARKFPERVMNALGATLHDGGICDGEALCGHGLVFGNAIGFDLEDLESAPGLIIWGCDLARTVQHSLPRVRALCRAGKPVVVVDVHRSATVRRVERWGGTAIVLRPGTDAALLLALAREAFERGAVDRDARAVDCHGLAEFEASLSTAPTLEAAAGICGIGVDEARALHDLLTTTRAWTKAGIGWSRRFQGANAMRALCCLIAVHGLEQNFHFESGDLFPEVVASIVREDLRPAEAPQRVVAQVGLGRALEAGDYGAVFVWGHNPVVTLPNSTAVRRGLEREDCFLVVHELFLTETAEVADVVLPAASFLEQSDLYFSYGHRHAQLTRRILAPPGEACGNVEAFSRIARVLDLPDHAWSATGDERLDALAELVGERLDEAGRARLAAGEPVKLEGTPGVERGTLSGKLELVSEAAVELGGPRTPEWLAGDPPREAGRFQLHCAPTEHSHNSTYLHSPRHVARIGAPSCSLHPDDARELGLSAGSSVRLSNPRAALTLALQVTDEVPRGMVRVDGLFCACDTPEGLGLNALTAPDPGDLGRGNTYYSTRVDVARADSSTITS